MIRFNAVPSFIVGLAAFASGASAADLPLNKLPTDIKHAIEHKFPGSTIEKAFTEPHHIEVVTKLKSGVTVELVFKTVSFHVLVEEEVPVGNLPVAIVNAVEGKYPGAQIKRAQSVSDAKGKHLFYTLGILFKGLNGEVHVNQAGKFVNEP